MGSSLIQRSSQVLMNTYGRFPLVLVKGQGSWVWDEDGKKYLDLVAGIAVNVLGHAHPRMLSAIQDQAAKLIHVSNLYHIPSQVELAEALTRSSFADRVFFCNSGAEANEGAVKLARKYFKTKGEPQKYKVITLENSFHGRTLAMISATGQEKYQKGFEPKVDGFVHVPWNNLEAMESAITPETAAILIEPIQGEGGIQVASSEYLKGIRSLCQKHNLLLIYDEVQTGVGRTGTFFAHEFSGVTPDILTLAKGLAGGVPIGALLATEEVAQAFSPGDHAATFGGNPLATRVALEVFQVLQEEILQNCQIVGSYFLEKLSELKSRHTVIQEVRGRGLMLGIELEIPGKDLVLRAMEKGLLINCTHENVLRFVPPLILKKEEVDWAVDVLEQLLIG